MAKKGSASTEKKAGEKKKEDNHSTVMTLLSTPCGRADSV